VGSVESALSDHISNFGSRVPKAVATASQITAGVDVAKWGGSSDVVEALSRTGGTVARGTVTSSALAPTVSHFQSGEFTETTTGHYNDLTLKFTTGSLAEQGTSISKFSSVGGRGQFKVVPMTEAPAHGDSFVVQ
jgi:hypothetical protein